MKFGLSRWRDLTTPARLRALVAAALTATVALLAVLEVAVVDLRDDLKVIGHKSGPAVMSTADLYFVLTDMDTQVANTLLVGRDTDLGVTRSQTMWLYEERRRQAARDLQEAIIVLGDDRTGQRDAQAAMKAYGRYQSLTSEAMLLSTLANHPAGQAPPAAIEKYRAATDLLRASLLPAAQRLMDDESQHLAHTYEDRHNTLVDLRIWLVVAGLALLAALVGIQLHLARKFRRRLNVGLVVATAATIALTTGGLALLTNEIEWLRAAKQDAFDSVLTISRARALSYDAAADQSRFLLDAQRAPQYEKAFHDKSGELTHDNGLFKTALRNITAPGEGPKAAAVLTTYVAYHGTDQRIRELARAGRHREAIALRISSDDGKAAYLFSQYDTALSAHLQLKRDWFDIEIKRGEDGLNGWSWLPWAAFVLIVGGVLLGVRPRLSEYR